MADEEKKENEDELEEGDERAEDVEGGEDENSGGSSKKILMIVLPILLLVAIGGGLYFSGFLDKYLGKEETVEHSKEETTEEEMIDDPVFVKLDDILVSLNSPANRPQYLRLSVQLELKKPEDQAIVEKMMPRIIDKIRGYLSELRVQDLRGSMGIARLRTELKARVNLAIKPIEIKNVLFQEILIQ